MVSLLVSEYYYCIYPCLHSPPQTKLMCHKLEGYFPPKEFITKNIYSLLLQSFTVAKCYLFLLIFLSINTNWNKCIWFHNIFLFWEWVIYTCSYFFHYYSTNTKKHCILISNSPPYALPALESASYGGLGTEQLAVLLSEVSSIHLILQ